MLFMGEGALISRLEIETGKGLPLGVAFFIAASTALVVCPQGRERKKPDCCPQSSFFRDLPRKEFKLYHRP